MSRLDELIMDLCPDGVESIQLCKVVAVDRGKRVVKKQLLKQGKYPVYQNSLTPLGYHSESNFPKNMTFVIGAGAAGEIGFSSDDFWAADDCFPLVCGDKILDKYLYHVLLNNKIYIMSRVRKASIPRLSRSVIEKLEIPVPPLAVQSEIVSILDKFTELTTELMVELTARKKQYEYYRNKLLSFNTFGITSNIAWRTLGEVCNLKAGKSITSSKISREPTSQYCVPCYGGNGLRGYVCQANQHGENSLIGRQGALCGNVCYVTGDYYATEHAVVVTNKGYFNNRFLYHLLVYEKLNQYKTAGAQPGLSVSRLEKVVIPVPDIAIQDKIANVLDNFDTICSDLDIGLPAEIEARQKQYEYYRDALLTYAATGKIITRQTDRQTDRQGLIRLIQYVFGSIKLELGELCNSIASGKAKTGSEIGKYPVYGSTGIISMTDSPQYFKSNILIARVGANAGFVHLAKGEYDVSDNTLVVDLQEGYNQKYIFYFLENIGLNKFAKGGGQPLVTAGDMKKVIINVPTRQKQDEIVNILDKFSTLCNDLSSGLPAEIEARQKQYEYYRDKLLTFKEKR